MSVSCSSATDVAAILRAHPVAAAEYATQDATGQWWDHHPVWLDEDGDLVQPHPTGDRGPIAAPTSAPYSVYGVPPFAVISHISFATGGQYRGDIVSLHASLSEAQSAYVARRAGDGRVSSLAVVCLTWTNGERARGPLADPGLLGWYRLGVTS